jgi:hypothetical protein
LSAGAAFDYTIIRRDHEGVHEWLFRRWHGFNVAANSFVGLLISIFFGTLVIGIPFLTAWPIVVVIFLAALLPVAIFAWRDTMIMLDFMISLKRRKAAPQRAPLDLSSTAP